MTGRLPRRVDGYPVYQFAAGSGQLTPNQTMVFSDSNGPGEVLGFAIFKWAGNNADYALLGGKIVIDSVTIFDTYLTWLTGADMTYAFHHLMTTNDIQSSQFACFSFKLTMAYESSMSITFKNQSSNNISIAAGVHARVGA